MVNIQCGCWTLNLGPLIEQKAVLNGISSGPLPQAHPRCLILDRLQTSPRCFTVFLAELAFSLLKRHSPPFSSPRHCLAAKSCHPNPSFQHSLHLPSDVPSSVALHPYSQMERGILTSACSFSLTSLPGRGLRFSKSFWYGGRKQSILMMKDKERGLC